MPNSIVRSTRKSPYKPESPAIIRPDHRPDPRRRGAEGGQTVDHLAQQAQHRPPGDAAGALRGLELDHLWRKPAQLVIPFMKRVRSALRRC